MASAKTIKRIENLTWALIFLGLFAIVFAIAMKQGGVGMHWPLGIIGAAMAIAGGVLIWVRSRLTEDS